MTTWIFISGWTKAPLIPVKLKRWVYLSLTIFSTVAVAEQYVDTMQEMNFIEFIGGLETMEGELIFPDDAGIQALTDMQDIKETSNTQPTHNRPTTTQTIRKQTDE